MWHGFTVSARKRRRKKGKGRGAPPPPFQGFKGYKPYDPGLHSPIGERRYEKWAKSVNLTGSFDKIDPNVYRDWLLDTCGYRPTQKALISKYIKRMYPGDPYLLRLLWVAAARLSRISGGAIEPTLNELIELASESDPNFQPVFDFIESNLPTFQEELETEYQIYLEALAGAFPQHVPAGVRQDVSATYGGPAQVPITVLQRLEGRQWVSGIMSLEEATKLVSESDLELPTEAPPDEYFENFSPTAPIVVLVDSEGNQEFLSGWENLVLAGSENLDSIPVWFARQQPFNTEIL